MCWGGTGPWVLRSFTYVGGKSLQGGFSPFLPQGSSLAGPPCEVIPATGRERVGQGAPPVPDKLSNPTRNYSLLTEASSQAGGRALGGKAPRSETCHIFQKGLFATTKITFPRKAECLPRPFRCPRTVPKSGGDPPRHLRPIHLHSLRSFLRVELAQSLQPGCCWFVFFFL